MHSQADLDFLPEVKVLCALELCSFLLSALADRFSAGVVDSPWPCYERQLRSERWKTEESGYSQVKVFEA